MNNNNLKAPQSTAEARERGILGGIASGKSKRRKQALKELISELINMPVTDSMTLDKLKKFFPQLEHDSLNYINLAFMRVLQDMTDGSTKAIDRIKIIEFIRDTIGEKPVENITIDDYKAETMRFRSMISDNFSDSELISMIKTMYQNDNNKGENNG